MERRFVVAYTQATLCQGKVFRGRHKRLEVEIIDVMRAAYGLESFPRTDDWFLSTYSSRHRASRTIRVSAAWSRRVSWIS